MNRLSRFLFALLAAYGIYSTHYLWLLHRTPTIDEATKQEYLAYAQSLGYDLSDLIDTVHTGKPTA